MSDERSLGQTLKAARLGYCWAPRLSSWLRVRDDVRGFVVELVPVHEQIPSQRPQRSRAVHERPELLDELVALVVLVIGGPSAGRVRLRRSLTLVLDHDGAPMLVE